MTFYKRDGDTLLTSPDQVTGPGFTLTADTHADYTYPVHGWYWFNTLDEALTGMQPISTNTVTMRQARLAMLNAGILDTANNMIATMPGPEGDAARITWEFSNEVHRTDPLVVMMGSQLGLSTEQLDDLFITASTL